MRHYWLILLLFVSTGINAQQDDSNTGNNSTTKDVFEWFIKNHPGTNRDASESGYDQLTKETEPVSPQAATMQRFGEYPMDYSTGVPHISIPLYEIKLGNYTLPVSITYHASGIKVQDVASPVGLGWSLSAGGYIIRQEKSGVDKGLFTFKSEDEIENAVDEPSFWPNLVRSKQYNTESDRYAYCFNGKNGVFRYAILDSMKIKTIPYDPIIIEENGTGYKITDTDGIKYYFMAEEKNRGDFTYGGNLETMAWYLTKIEFADRNDSIVFKYAQDAYYYQQYISEYRHQGTQYSYSSNIWTATNASAIEDGSAIHTTECANMLLKEIVWRGNKVIFSYNNDRTDHVMMINNNFLPRLSTMTVQNYSGNTVRTVTFDNAHYSGSTALTYRMILEGVTISGSSVSAGTEDYTFDYNSTSLPNYYNATFTYPSAKDGNCHEDYWGYYNGTNTTYWTPDSCMPTGMTGANRSVNQTYAKAGILERITYPTGGYTDFSYESNQLDNGTLWGGLRLSNASSYDSGGSLLSQRTYQYSGSRVPVTTSLSTLYNYECPYWYYYHEWTDHLIHYSDQPLHTISLSHPYLSLTGDYGSPIYYSAVTEYYGTVNNNQGKTIYYYEDSRAYDYYEYRDEEASSAEPLRLYSMDYNVDNGNITPLLSKKEVYENNNGAYTLNHSEQYDYDEVVRPAFNVGVRFQSRLAYIDRGGSSPYPEYNDLEDIYSYHDVIAVPSFVRLASKTVRDYQAKVAITTTYDYDDNYRTLDPISEKVSSASGDYYRTDYSYPFNMNGSDYASMDSANMMVPVETRLYRNGTLTQTVRRDYTHQNGIFVNTSVSTAKGIGSLEQRMQYTYDSYGNLTSAVKGGTEKTAFIWSYNRMYPVAEVRGLTYAQAYTAANGVVTMSSFPDTYAPSASNISSIGTALNGAGGLATVYTYTPLIGITSMQSPRGERTYFTYDAMGRLAYQLNHNSYPIEGYTYNYGTQSYVRKRTMTSTTGSSYREMTDYYDGIGRKSETVLAGQAPGGGDLVTLTEYDGLNRPVKEWLPTVFSNSGGYVSPSSYTSATRTYYESDQKPYSLTEYETCPSDKVLKQYGPGSDWQNNSKAVQKVYTANTTSSPLDCRIYEVESNGAALKCTGTYDANELFVVQTTDEDSKVSYTFTDKEGRLVLERRMNGSTACDTYYVYDIYGNLTFVLPPLASDALTATNTTWSISSNDALKRYAYNYQYDSRNRCIQKKLPGCDYITMTYDTADRLITRQDGVQRDATISTYYEYDGFGRQTEMGTKNALNVETPLLKYFYDDYSSLTATNLAINTSAGSDAAFPNNSSPNARGLLTGTWSALLNNISTGYYTSYYYGERERLVQSHAQNHLGGVNDTYYTYNYIGTTATRKQVHSATGQNTQTELYSYTYDNGDRLLNTSYQLNGGTAVTLNVNTYDAVGRLSTHKPLNIETQTYGYNVRSWLTGISSTNFTEKLAYNTAVNGLTPDVEAYGGNIAAMQWQTGNESRIRGFQFEYTPLGFLDWADYEESGRPYAYDVYYYYDKMGNMTGFERNGHIENNLYDLVDIPYFTYDGNQPTRIDDEDWSLTFPYNGGYHFIDYVQQNNEYTYDKNGNMTQDLNKRISSIQYNLLNLPQDITFSTGSTIAYTYDAEGRKLNVTYGSPSKTINYSGNMVYENGTLSQILTEGGYVTLSGTTPTYHAYLRDHQGNNRVVINDSGTIEQVNHYYPFGYFFGESTNASTQRYKYNDKEFDEMHGLHWYDYGARHYDPAIMRFTTMDPMCEKYYHLSPYAYCGNNPVNAVDDDGRRVLYVNGYYNSLFGFLSIGPSEGYENYWSTNFVNRAQRFFNENSYIDYRNFIDGSSIFGGDKSGNDRFYLGQKYAEKHFKDLTYNLREGEAINIVTHSEGAAYGAGIAKYLISKGIKVGTILHLSADEGDEFSTPVEPFTIQFSYDNDWITNNHFIKGTDVQIISKQYNNKKGSWKYVHGQTNHRSVFDLIEDALNKKDLNRYIYNFE